MTAMHPDPEVCLDPLRCPVSEHCTMACDAPTPPPLRDRFCCLALTMEQRNEAARRGIV